MKNTRINVAIRVRPLLDFETKKGDKDAENMNINTSTNKITLSGRIRTSYSFDKVLYNESQSELYEK